MKKLLPLILATTLLTASPVFAADIDLTSMTVDELLDLRHKVDDQIASMAGIGTPTSLISEGSYIVGQDIKEGNYVLMNIQDSYMLSFLYNSKEDYDNAGDYSMGTLEQGESITLNLRDGMYLLLQNGTCLISEASFSWAP